MEESPGWYVCSKMHLRYFEIASLEAWAGIEGIGGGLRGFRGFSVQHNVVRRCAENAVQPPACRLEGSPLLCRRHLRLSAPLALESPLFSIDFPPPRPQLSHAKRRQLRRPAATPDTMLSAGGAAASLALLMLLPLLCCCHLCHSLRKFFVCLFFLDCFFFLFSSSTWNCNFRFGMQTMV